MRLVVDDEACAGHGMCYGLVPTVMTDDERGHGVVVGDGVIGPELEEDARRAVFVCPEQALQTVEGAGE